MTGDLLTLELAVRAYSQGYATGSNLLKAGRHVVEPEVHEHWRAGYEDGRAAARRAAGAYQERLKQRPEQAK